MDTDPPEALAHVAFASQLVALAAALETARATHNGLTRAAEELHRLAEQTPAPSGPSAG